MSIENNSFIVINGSVDDVMTDIRVMHKDTNDKNCVLCKADRLEFGRATEPVNFTGISNYSDYWAVYFTVGIKSYRVYSKECALYESDSNGVVAIVLYKESFSICTPQSNGCYNIGYDDPTSMTTSNAVVRVINQTNKTMETSILDFYQIDPSVFVLDQLEIGPLGSRDVLIETGGIIGQSFFNIKANFDNGVEGEFRYELGMKPLNTSRVIKLDEDKDIAGFVVPNASGFDYDFLLYAGQNIMPPFLNSILDANLDAIEGAINQGLNFTIKDKFEFHVGPVSGLNFTKFNYANFQRTDKGASFTLIVANDSTLKTSLNVTEDGEKYIDDCSVSFEGLEILLCGFMEIENGGANYKLHLSNLKVNFSDYDINIPVSDLALFSLISPILGTLISEIYVNSKFVTTATLAGVLNSLDLADKINNWLDGKPKLALDINALINPANNNDK